MSKQVPFVVHIRVVPERPGKRFEYLRSLHKLAILAHDALREVSGVTVADPGGGQQWTAGDIDRRSGFSDLGRGTGVKPQMGQVPAQLMIAGFHTSTAKNDQPWAEQELYSGGEKYKGPGAHAHDAVPTATVNDEVKALKTAIKNALTTAFPAGTTFSIFRIDYAGIVYGDKGFHFPR